MQQQTRFDCNILLEREEEAEEVGANSAAWVRLIIAYTSIALDKFIKGRSTANDKMVAPRRLMNKTTQK